MAKGKLEAQQRAPQHRSAPNLSLWAYMPGLINMFELRREASCENAMKTEKSRWSHVASALCKAVHCHVAARKAELWGVMASSRDSAAVEEATQEAELLEKSMPEMGWSSQQCADKV